MNLPRRKGRKRDFKINLLNVRDGEVVFIPVDASDSPRVLSLPVLPPPGLMLSDEDIRQIARQPTQMWCYLDKKHVRRTLTRYEAKAVLTHCDIPEFCRMVAKIIHAFAAAEIPREVLASFRLWLPDYIVRGKNKVWQFVGGAVPAARSNFANELSVYTSTMAGYEFLVGTYRPFAWLHGPAYAAIIGSRMQQDTPATPIHARSPPRQWTDRSPSSPR